jgi:hypothetical protein
VSGAHIRFCCIGRHVIGPDLFEKKSDDMLFDLVQILGTVMAEKLGLQFFELKNLFFNLFLTQNTLKTIINLSVA